MFNPLKIFKKKPAFDSKPNFGASAQGSSSEIPHIDPLETQPSSFGGGSSPDPLSNPSPTPSFGSPSTKSYSSESSGDKQELVLSKLSAIEAKIDNLDQRLKNIERLAEN